ncbi:hypothetical protein K438DRAFT_2006666 [Mycena galopus ATCC 62051]|nr:hypothetical protein K438DRAFT_2006666 [Mycena galopus ATCC 62051]
MPTERSDWHSYGPGLSRGLGLEALLAGLGLGLENPKPRPAQAGPKPGPPGQAGPWDSLDRASGTKKCDEHVRGGLRRARALVLLLRYSKPSVARADFRAFAPRQRWWNRKRLATGYGPPTSCWHFVRTAPLLRRLRIPSCPSSPPRSLGRRAFPSPSTGFTLLDRIVTRGAFGSLKPKY